MLAVGCVGIGAVGYVVLRNVVPAATSSLESDNATQHFELPSSAASADAVVLQDDFAADTNGWSTYDDDDASINYVDGTYRMVIGASDSGVWETHRSVRLQRLGDVRVEVDVQQLDGYDDDTFGILCRAGEDGYYALEISTDGWYGIGKVDGDKYTLLVGPDEEPARSDNVDVALPQAEQPAQRLRADCIGDTLTLYVDGEKVAEVKDASYKTGSVGLAAYNIDAPRTEVLFDNFVVRTP